MMAIMSQVAPWTRGRGLSRLLARETNVSDMLQFLSDRDPTPWACHVGFVPAEVIREASEANNADLLLTADSRSAVLEVKLGHLMSSDQQERYETLASSPDLYLAALNFDRGRLPSGSDRWRFLSLSELLASWSDSDDESARLIAREAAATLQAWDDVIERVFATRGTVGSLSLATLDQKFLARVVTRRVALELQQRKRRARAGVTSGGGLPLVQAWTPVRGEDYDRSFMAEVRWWETKPGGELRFGVDFEPRPEGSEDEEVRRAAYDLAASMDADIEFRSLKAALEISAPDLAPLLRRDTPSRPRAKGDWEQVIIHGFSGAPLQGGAKNNRRRTTPGYYGDGALRFQSIAEIDFAEASAEDLTDLIDATLTYLSSRQP